MKKRSLIFVLGLVPLVPCSSRFGYGILLTIEIWGLFSAVLVSVDLANLLDLKIPYVRKSFSMLFTMAITTVFLLFTAILFPVCELTLRFYIYFTAFSYILGFCVDDYLESYQSFSIVSFYTVFMLGFSFIRELLFFGTISFLVPNGLFSLRIIPNEFLVFKFLGTNGGTLILLGIAIWIYFSVKKSKIIRFIE